MRVLLVFGSGLFALAMIGAIILGGAYLYFGPQLPEPGAIGEPKLNEPLRIYAADGRLLGEFGTERRLPKNFDDIPTQVVQAFLAAEDDRFFEHPGVDYQGIARAAWHLLVTGDKTQGGSTITMQLARNLYLTNARTYSRKIKEIFLALRIEAKLTKQQILEIYLNKIYLGNRAYGVGAAAQVYYDRELEELSLAQLAMIAGLPKAPSRYNPLANPERATERRNYVLRRMLELDNITPEQYRLAIDEEVTAGDRTPRDKRYEADYVAEMVRQEMVQRFGEAAYTDGYRVYTTINSRRQRAANRALRRGLLAYDQRHEWRGVEASVDPASLANLVALKTALAERPEAGGLALAVVRTVRARQATLFTEKYGEVGLTASRVAWLKKGQSLETLISPGDIVRLAYTGDDNEPWALAQVPKVQGALVALDPEDGAIESLAGGFDFNISKFNRAIQARRQPGSAFKPFLYSAALANGYTPASIINDAPVVFDDPGLDRSWRPQNYTGRVYGPTRLREGLVQSRNLVTIRLMRGVGIDTSRNYITKFGLPRDQMPRDLSLSLGSASFSPLQMAQAYAVFANGGYLVEPYFIREIRDEDGNLLEQADPVHACPDYDCSGLDEGKQAASQVIEPENAYLMYSMMRDVITQGTGRRATKLGRSDVAGKTGTTNDQKDAWFTGFTPRLVAVCWVGFDQLQPLGSSEAGSKAALPVWIDYMDSALRNIPEASLKRPANLVTVRINPDNGLLAIGDGGISETFRADQIPRAGRRESFDNYDSYDDGSRDRSAGGGNDVEQLF